MAVATPCWPAPVSAMMRRLPMRRASSTWPSVLLILCAPVWQRSSRLSSDAAAARLGAHAQRVAERGRAAGEAGEQAGQLLGEGRVAPGLLPGGRELVERRDQRLGDEASAVGAEVAGGVGNGHGRRTSRTAVMKRDIRAGSFTPVRLDAARHVDGPGADGPHGVGDVLRGEAARQDHRRHLGDPLGERPVEGLARCRRSRATGCRGGRPGPRRRGASRASAPGPPGWPSPPGAGGGSRARAARRRGAGRPGCPSRRRWPAAPPRAGSRRRPPGSRRAGDGR